MNMLLHGIPDADIRQEDTIPRPQHKDDKNELKRYDRVLANPPFSQNYIKKDTEYPGRFDVWMPESAPLRRSAAHGERALQGRFHQHHRCR
jgi:type I restriction enzyme M protein